MKKRHLLTALTLGLATGYGAHQDAQDDLAGQVKALEKRLDSVEGYLARQVEADKAVLKAVDKSVAEGFTAGINFEARQTLVGAWRSRAAAAASNVPGGKAEDSGDSADPRRRRRDR